MVDCLAADLCVSAAMASVKDVIDNFTWDKSSKDTVHPTPTNGCKTNRTITKTHFSQALSEVLPSFSEEASEELSRWHEIYSTTPNVVPQGANDDADDDANENRHNMPNGNVRSEMNAFLEMMNHLRK
jgi:hypothetical protein